MTISPNDVYSNTDISYNKNTKQSQLIKSFSNSYLFKHLATHNNFEHYRTKDYMQQPSEKNIEDQERSKRVQELVRRLRQCDQQTQLGRLKKYSQVLGKLLIGGLKKAMELFTKHLLPFNNQSLKQEEAEESKIVEEKDQQKKRGFKVNFKEFTCTDAQIEAANIKPKHIQEKPAPVRTFAFNQNDFQDEKDVDSDSQDLAHFLSKIGTKRVKRESQETKCDPIVDVILMQTPEQSQHFSELYNQINIDYAMELGETLEKQKEKKKLKPKQHEEQDYQSYYKQINQGHFEMRKRKDPMEMLQNLKRRQRQRVEQRPPRRKLSFQKDTPQIYNVKKVLEIFDQQCEDFLKKKREDREQKKKLQAEARRIEEEARQVERMEEERLEALRRQQQNINQRQHQENHNNEEIQQNKNQNVSQNVIDERQHQIEDNSEEHSFGLVPRRQRKHDNSIKDILSNSPSQQANVQVEHEVSDMYQTPPRPKSPEVKQQNDEEKQMSPHPPLNDGPNDAGENSAKVSNPFKGNTPCKGLNFTDLFKGQPKPFPTISLQPSSNIFNNPNPSVPSIFGNISAASPRQTAPPQQQSTSLFPSPPQPHIQHQQQPHLQRSMFQNQGSLFPSIQTPNPPTPTLGQQPYSPSGAMMSNLGSGYLRSNNSYDTSNMNPNAQGTPLPPNTNPAPSGSSMFTNNPNAARMFQNNMFMGGTNQSKSLFGDAPSQPSREVPQRSGRNKKVRIVS